MPTLDNGQWVPDDHPLYQEELAKKKQGGTATGGGLQGFDATTGAAAPETAATAPGLTPSHRTTLAEEYQKAFGTAATEAQLDYFESQDPAAMLAHIRGMGAQAAGAAGTPAATGTPGAAAPVDESPAGAAAAGLAWVPKDHPLYGTPGYVGSTAGGQAPPVAGGSGTSAPPTGAPTGTPEEILKQLLIDRATQGTDIDTTDPEFRLQADAFAEARERARRNAHDDTAQAAFAAGLGGSGAVSTEQRMADEAAFRDIGQFEAELVGRELQSRRAEVAGAIEQLGNTISDEQKLALQRELAALDAAIKREGLAVESSLGSTDLTLRDKLGTGALNVDLLTTLLNNHQFDKGLGFDIGNAEANYFLRSLGL
jgi:hypothetical protein